MPRQQQLKDVVDVWRMHTSYKTSNMFTYNKLWTDSLPLWMTKKVIPCFFSENSTTCALLFWTPSKLPAHFHQLWALSICQWIFYTTSLIEIWFFPVESKNMYRWLYSRYLLAWTFVRSNPLVSLLVHLTILWGWLISWVLWACWAFLLPLIHW